MPMGVVVRWPFLVMLLYILWNRWELKTFQVVAAKSSEVREQTVNIIHRISKVPNIVQNHWITSVTKKVVTIKAITIKAKI